MTTEPIHLLPEVACNSYNKYSKI